MKKKFIEPEMKRIELNLNENIASSDGVKQTVLGAFIVSHALSGCLESVQDTEYGYPEFYFIDAAWDKIREPEYNCVLIDAAEAARRMGMPVPKNIY